MVFFGERAAGKAGGGVAGGDAGCGGGEDDAFDSPCGLCGSEDAQGAAYGGLDEVFLLVLNRTSRKGGSRVEDVFAVFAGFVPALVIR